MTPTLALSSGDIATIVVVVVVALFAILLVGSFVRARRHQAELAAAGEEGAVPEAAPPPAERAPRAPRAVTRREFFRRSLVGSLGIFTAQFGGASLAFLWPNLKGGFGSVINAGQLSDIQNQIQQTHQPFYVGVGRFYVVPYSGKGKDEATGTDYEADGVISNGLMPLYQRCVHLGCRVPFCMQSQWFECPCHGSKYNQAGEYKLGPAPHGMDRFKITVDSSGNVMVDTSVIIIGPPRGTDTTHQSAQGPFCVAPG